MDEFLHFMKHIVQSKIDLPITKSIPATPQQKKDHKAIDQANAELESLKGKYSALKKKFWADIELSMNDYSPMQYNPKTDCIEILGEPEESNDKSIKSPFQFSK